MKKQSLQELLSPQNYSAPLLTQDEKSALLKKPSHWFSLRSFKYFLLPLCLCIVVWLWFIRFTTHQWASTERVEKKHAPQIHTWWWFMAENAYYDTVSDGIQEKSSIKSDESNAINVIWAWSWQLDSSTNVIKWAVYWIIIIVLLFWGIACIIKKMRKKE